MYMCAKQSTKVICHFAFGGMVVEFTDMALGKTVVDPTSGRGTPFTNDGYYSILFIQVCCI